ncbi:MAG TPA: aminotransferase class I/II-fold pyridoxal phosphate-dependent enzyme [Solirubrobacteraceae bacterium]|nr:aminotransferase class I/II-fold pyridoxal phosphate-dependent enzyme [Solirubrobacteraceae bacterium]
MRDRPRPPLTLEPEELRRLGHRVVDAIVEHWERIGELPPIRTGDAARLRAAIGAPPPDAPGDPDAALDTLLQHVLPFVQHGDHPRFFARIGSPSNPVSALADALGAGLNVFAGSWAGGSGPATLELVVLDWLRSWCGLPGGTEGILVSGGSVASLTALAAAREARPGRRVAIVSDQTHASVARALRLLGVEVRTLATDDGFRLRPADVEAALTDDTLCVVATAGTTNTGAVDPLDELADACGDVWLHVDGAYGGPAVLTERGAALLRGLGRADSVALDPHKLLFQPYEVGSVLVRHPGALERAFTVFGEYLRDVASGPEVNFRDRGPQLSRGSRALKLWLSLQTFGLDAFRAAIDRVIDLGERAQRSVDASDELEVVTPAQLGILTFAPRGRDAGDIAERMVAQGFAAPSSTVLRGRTVLRMCTVNPRTTDEDVDRTIAAIAALA